MGLEALLENVARDATRQARGILAEARDEAKRLVREAEERVAEELERRLERRETELRRSAARRLAAAEREALELELGARERYFERIFEAVRERLSAPQSSDLLRAGLASRLARLLIYLPDRPATIHCWAGIAPDVERAIGGLEGVKVEPDAASPSALTAEAGGGAVLVDESLERRLDTIAGALRIELAKEAPEQA